MRLKDVWELSFAGVPYRMRWCPPSAGLEGFWAGETPVTQAHWLAVTGKNPSTFQGRLFKDDLRRPVETVTFDECVNFGALFGLRLPTEAEWAHACRSGRKTEIPKTKFDSFAWTRENSGGWTTHPVGQKRPNAWGLYDMIGNVQEWARREDFFDAICGGHFNMHMRTTRIFLHALAAVGRPGSEHIGFRLYCDPR